MKITTLLTLVMVTVFLGAAGVFLVQNSASGQDSAAGTPLETFAATGNKVQVTAFLNALAERNKEPKGDGSGFSMHLHDPFQIMEFGKKRGVLSFVNSLPKGSTISLLVTDVRKLAALGDKEPVLIFMLALRTAGIKVELLVVDASGLSYAGEMAGLLSFLASLPDNSVVKLYTTPSEISNNGADAGLLAFIRAVPCRLEVLVDDPLVRSYLVR